MFVAKFTDLKMKSPSPLLRGLFAGGVGALLVSVLFSINGWPAAELFSIIGAVSTVSLHFVFSRHSTRRSVYSRHVLVVALSAAIVMKSFGLIAAGWLFLIAFMAFLVWFTWSVLEELPIEEE